MRLHTIGNYVNDSEKNMAKLFDQKFNNDVLIYTNLIKKFYREKHNFEIDQIIVVGNRIIIVDVKDWNYINANNKYWYRKNGEAINSPISKLDSHAKKMKSEIVNLLQKKNINLYIDYAIVLSNPAVQIKILDDATRSKVFQYNEFIKYINDAASKSKKLDEKDIEKVKTYLSSYKPRTLQKINIYNIYEKLENDDSYFLYKSYLAKNEYIDNKVYKLTVYSFDQWENDQVLKKQKEMIMRETNALLLLSGISGVARTELPFLWEDKLICSSEYYDNYKSLKYIIDNNILDKQKYSIIGKLKIVLLFAKVLQEVHRKEVVHRDIKPANILYDFESDQIWIKNFEISKIDVKNIPTVSKLIRRFNRDFNKKYSNSLYISPEVYEDPHFADKRSDIYSLGITIWEFLTGSTPYGNIVQIKDHYTLPDSIDFSDKKGLEDILSSMLQEEEEERMQSITELIGYLKNIF